MLSQDVNPTGLIKGNVEWKFRLQWTPGGEESLTCHHNFYSLGHPWWAPISQRPTKDARYPLIQQVTLNPNFKRESEDKYPTTPRYRIARTCHPDYKFRDRPIGELYSSLLPLSLLAPFGPSVMDTTFPRGWYCTWCGKLNFQAALRQRKCSSLRCKVSCDFIRYYFASESCVCRTWPLWYRPMLLSYLSCVTPKIASNYLCLLTPTLSLSK